MRSRNAALLALFLGTSLAWAQRPERVVLRGPEESDTTAASKDGDPSYVSMVATVVLDPCPAGMVIIPEGAFVMGADDGDRSERPIPVLHLAAFCMDRTEVTVAAYRACVAAGACQPASTTAWWPGITEADHRVNDRWCNANYGDRDDHPVNCIDFDQAAGFCAWRGARLPTEAEWEYAARGDDGRIYPWGDAAPDAHLMNGCGPECVAEGARAGQRWTAMYDESDGWPTTAPVGSFPAGASPSGLLDMAGNVLEWTADPLGGFRIDRGSGWNTDVPSRLRTSQRSWMVPSRRSVVVGARCAWDAGGS